MAIKRMLPTSKYLYSGYLPRLAVEEWLIERHYLVLLDGIKQSTCRSNGKHAGQERADTGEQWRSAPG